ncbi:histidine kinase [Streptomyces sp. NBC_01571]|uniref:sensor histidine kinase n=1 Tax=Streptomyces sp. NBC_01571 TaxID=2975883 RepID=UPI00225C337F|nr:histidine kinase [Streptomyces sp. NBC_01571]MCX4576244.1 histidine kinase [Streptomyces sp. NBC_01571]
MSSTTAPATVPPAVSVPGAVPVVGSGFGEALHEGLVRAASRMSPRRGPAPGPADDTLGAWETDAVLDRFTARLPAVLAPAEAEVPALRGTLAEFARTVLVRAAETAPTTSAPSAADAPPAPVAPPAASPHQVAAAVALLLECALLHVLEHGIAHRESVLPRAVAVVRRLGEVLRDAGEGVWSGDDGRGERRRLARQLHDELGGALSTARHSLEAAATAATTPTPATPTASGARATTGPLTAPGSPTPPQTPAAHLAAAERALAEAARQNQAFVGGLRRRADLPPLREALEAFLAGPRPRAGLGIRTSVEVVGDERTLSEHYREETFLALREALRDRLTRSGARQVATVVRVTRRWLYAKVTDDGHGPATGSAEALRSLTDRIDDLGGRTRVTPGTPTGTLLEIHLPLRRHP